MPRLIEDRNSREWTLVKEYCKKRLHEMRRENDEKLDPVETSHLRGMIAFAIEVIDLDVDDPEYDVPDQTYLP